VYVIGLTGGIGSGKSTVTAVLQEQGATILDADKVGHEVYQPGRPAFQEVVDAFGEEIVAADGTIDRKKLGTIVFSDPRNLSRLNSITHPRMKGMMRDKLSKLRKDGVDITVIEAAILFEAGWDDLADEVWVTIVPPDVAAKRTSERSGLPQEQVLERIRAQMSNEERSRRADVIIDTDCDIEDTRRQAAERWQELQKRRQAAPSSR
jgi:dephospho-CoA kinase